jgi:hypothetical protein
MNKYLIIISMLALVPVIMLIIRQRKTMMTKRDMLRVALVMILNS